MTDKELIHNLNKRISKIYEENEIKCLRGNKDDNYILNGKEILVWYYETNSLTKEVSGDFDYNKLLDDLFFCSDEIMFSLANLYLYLPYINNPLFEAYFFNDRYIYPNFQNLEAKRFNMFADTVLEKLYKYWDRIGDLLASYFPYLLKPFQVEFTRIIDKIPESLRSNENFVWLNKFRNNEYKQFNTLRKNVVHYETIDTGFKYSTMKSVDDKESITKLMKYRTQFPEMIKKHIDYTLIGFEKTLNFISESKKLIVSEYNNTTPKN